MADAPKQTNGDGRWRGLRRRLYGFAARAWQYWNVGIWQDPRTTMWVNLAKTARISVHSFLDKGLQNKACALTYRTTLAVVPAMAMLFAIGRGFGFQALLREELFRMFPAQHAAIEYALRFVDSYLSHASEGLFVGIGLVFLVWTLISLLGSVEDVFNTIWDVRQSRSYWRKISDYTAMLLILPLLLICAGGISVFMSSSLQSFFDFSFMTPVIGALLEAASWLFTWLFFAGTFILIPNARVRIPNALVAGVLTGTAFKVLQWLFVTGQLYVTKYNAIYGSFAFLPLMLLWMQLTWMIVLCGALVCYSSQSIFQYSFSVQVKDISPSYRRRVIIAVATLVVKRFQAAEKPLTAQDIARVAEIPPKLLGDVTGLLVSAGIINRVVIDMRREIYGYQPAVSPDILTIGYLRDRLDNLGSSDFIPGSDRQFHDVEAAVARLEAVLDHAASDVLLSSLRVGDTDKDTHSETITQ